MSIRKGKNMRIKSICVKLIAICVAILMLNTPLLHTFASEYAQTNTIGVSQWAIDEVNMASLYELAQESIYSNLKSNITNNELVSLAVSLYIKLNDNMDSEELVLKYKNKVITDIWGEEYDSEGLSTRKEVIEVLYNIIKETVPDVNGKVSINYLVEAKILRGRGNKDLDLHSHCNREELLVMAKRTYEFVLRKTNRASKGYFYKIHGGKSEVYLLGSIHMADISIYPLEEKIEDAFNKADYIAVEADVSNLEDTTKYIQQKALFYDGTTIDKVLTPETFELYKEQVEQYGFEPEVYNVLKPWYAAMLLQNLSLQQHAYEAGLGIDLYFLLKSKNKKVIEIEGVKFQIDLLDNFSPEIQEMFLLDILLSIQNNDEGQSQSTEVMQYMLEVWRQGSEEELEKLVAVEGSEHYSEFSQLFWIQRNKNMTKRIVEYLNDNNEKTYFVIVGAGHIVGNSGVVKELLDQGYTVSQ